MRKVFVLACSVATALLIMSGPSAAAYNPANIPSIANVAGLLAIPSATAAVTPTMFLAGYYSSGDGMCPSTVTWNAASTATADNGYAFNPSGHPGNGRWIRNFSGTPSINCWGAAPTISDNGLLVAAAVAWANSQNEPTLLTASVPGTYSIPSNTAATLPIIFNENATGLTSAQQIIFQFNTVGEGMIAYGSRKLFENVTWANSNASSRADATFTANSSGTTLTVSGISGIIQLGDRIDKGTGSCVPIGTYISAFGTGTGGNGTYTTSAATTCSTAANVTAGHYQAVLDLVNAPYSTVRNYSTFSNGQYYGGILARQIYNKGYSWEDINWDADVLCHIGNWYSSFENGKTVYDTVGANVGFGLGIHTDFSAKNVVNPPIPPCVTSGTYNGSSSANRIVNLDTESMDADILLDGSVANTQILGGIALGGNYGIESLNNSQGASVLSLQCDQPAQTCLYEDGSSDTNSYGIQLALPGNPTPWAIGTINPKSRFIYSNNNSTSPNLFWNRSGLISVAASGTTTIQLPNTNATYIVDISNTQTPTTDYIAVITYNGSSVTGLGSNIGPSGADITLADSGTGLLTITNTGAGTGTVRWSLTMLGSAQN